MLTVLGDLNRNLNRNINRDLNRVQSQQPRRAEDRKAFDYIAVLEIFETPHALASAVNLLGSEMGFQVAK